MISVSSPPVIMGNHKHVQKDKYYWMEREGSEYNVSRKKDIVFCVTLYNESFDDLLCTLTSIAQSVKHSRSIELSSKRVAVCVICDGYERLDDNFIAEAKSMSWMDHRVESQPNDEGLHIFKTVFQPKLLPDSINKTGDDVKNTGDLDIEFCVKPKNRGKLDSHWWFFKKLCIAHQPKYCFQIDAGTMLKRHTLYEMLKVFRRKPDVAAVASNVIIDSKNAFDLLESFQCSDFVIQRASLWSAENFCGYMSVIPGQFCGISWPALIEKNDEGSTPVDRYLSGTECRTAHEKIMFLAEDRVLCAELLTDDGSEYTVDYAIDAECYTDACGTVDELLKQRRRWINSAFACRSWMLVTFIKYLLTSKLVLERKLRIVTSVLSMTWFHAVDFLQPLLTALLLTLTFTSLQHTVDAGYISQSSATVVFALLVSTWLMPTILAISGAFKKLDAHGEKIVLWSAATSTLGFLAINIFSAFNTGSLSTALAAILPLYLSILTLLSASAFGKNTLRIGFKTCCYCYLTSIPTYLMLYCNAFLNMNDSSWGTKGLDKENCNYSSSSRYLQGALDSYLSKFLGVWIATNLLVYMVIIGSGLLMLSLKVVSSLLVAYMIVGLVGSHTKKISNKKYNYSLGVTQ